MNSKPKSSNYGKPYLDDSVSQLKFEVRDTGRGMDK